MKNTEFILRLKLDIVKEAFSKGFSSILISYWEKYNTDNCWIDNFKNFFEEHKENEYLGIQNKTFTETDRKLPPSSIPWEHYMLDVRFLRELYVIILKYEKSNKFRNFKDIEQDFGIIVSMRNTWAHSGEIPLEKFIGFASACLRVLKKMQSVHYGSLTSSLEEISVNEQIDNSIMDIARLLNITSNDEFLIEMIREGKTPQENDEFLMGKIREGKKFSTFYYYLFKQISSIIFTTAIILFSSIIILQFLYYNYSYGNCESQSDSQIEKDFPAKNSHEELSIKPAELRVEPIYFSNKNQQMLQIPYYTEFETDLFSAGNISNENEVFDGMYNIYNNIKTALQDQRYICQIFSDCKSTPTDPALGNDTPSDMNSPMVEPPETPGLQNVSPEPGVTETPPQSPGTAEPRASPEVEAKELEPLQKI